jgi:hypothetical protein
MAMKLNGVRAMRWLAVLAMVPAALLQGQSMPKAAPFYGPMMDAYDTGRVEEARQLAQKYLEGVRHELETYTLDLDRDGAARRATDLIDTLMSSEAELAPANRFTNHTDLMSLSRDVLRLAQDSVARIAQPSDALRQYFANTLAISSQAWISSAGPRMPRDQVQSFYQQFEPQMRSSGRVTDLDTLLRNGAQRHVREFLEKPRAAGINNADGTAILAVIRNYYDAVLAGDTPKLAVATGMSAQSASALIARRGDNFNRVQIRQISQVRLPNLNGAQVADLAKVQADGTYELLVRGIETTVTEQNGAAGTRTVEKLFTLKRTGTRWTVVVPQRGAQQ